jgi:hypothetical protein
MLCEQAVDHRLIPGKPPRQTRNRFGHMHVDHRHRFLGVVRRTTGQHLEQDDAETVEVGTFVDRSAARLLRADIALRTDRRTGGRQPRARGHRLGDAEIRQHRPPLLVEQDVLRLHVPMHEARGVRVHERVGHLAQNRQRLEFAQPFTDATTQIAAGEQTHRVVVNARGKADLEHGHDAAMVERCGGMDLLFEALHELRVVSELRRQHLECHAPVQHQILRLVDVGHAARPEQMQDLVVAELGVRREHG